MNAFIRYVAVSSLLLGAIVPSTSLIRRQYGVAAGRRFATGMAVTLALQQTLVALALTRRRDRERAHRLSLVDLMTLSRGCAAAILLGLLASRVDDRRGFAGWMGWLSLLYGAILCDWLDGPIARRIGTSEIGKVFDLEADSWLTFVAAGSSAGWGGMPRFVVLPAILRYVSTFMVLRDIPYAERHVDDPRWVRRLGIAQMLLFIASLAPFGGTVTRLAARIVAPVEAPLQIVGLALLCCRRRRR